MTAKALTKVDARSVTPEPDRVSAEVMEKVLATGDLSKLTPQQCVEYYNSVCRTLDLNPLTRPFDFMVFHERKVLYAKRDCTDQLRAIRTISLKVVEQKIEAGLVMVTVRAATPTGREDEDMGAVVLPPNGEARANAIMKAITKAKRRVTLSICGLGFLDESEVETLVPMGARVMDHAPDAALPAPVKVADEKPRKRTAAEFLDDLQRQFEAVKDRLAFDALVASDAVQNAVQTLRNGAARRLDEIINAAEARVDGVPAENAEKDDGCPGPQVSKAA